MRDEKPTAPRYYQSDIYMVGAYGRDHFIRSYRAGRAVTAASMADRAITQIMRHPAQRGRSYYQVDATTRLP